MEKEGEQLSVPCTGDVVMSSVTALMHSPYILLFNTLNTGNKDTTTVKSAILSVSPHSSSISEEKHYHM